MNFTLTKRSLYRNFLYFFTAILFFSCQKDFSLENGGGINNPPDLSTKINSSVSGFVTDENDVAVMGATVQFGTSNITTDKYGYFQAKNVQVIKNAAFITVSKPGYFKGIKTYIAKQGKAAFFRIKLIPKTLAGNVNGGSGGTVSLANGLSIKLPAGAVVNAASNAAYTGTVNIAAFWINPEAVDLDKIMPGDLRGINTEGAIKLLQTFGMAAVELTGASGELLQIANGQKATLTFPLPSSLSASAPATIPLWYFDETNGLWKEQGSAVKTGNTYVGDVSHFSYWNCDIPFPNAVNFDCTVRDAAGNPVRNAHVMIYYSNNQYTGCHGYTDSVGFAGGPVPANSQLIVKVLTSYNCVVFTQAFTTTNSNISLGILTLTGSVNNAVITGNILNCSNLPVTNGYVMMFFNNEYYTYAADSVGHFYITKQFCGNNIIANFVGIDAATSQEGMISNYQLVNGANNIGNITACGTSNQVFANYSVNSTPFSITPPPGFIEQQPDSLNFNAIRIGGWNISSGNLNFSFSKLNIGPGSIQNLTSFYSQQTGQTSIPAPISVNITEYGSIGQYISGNFSGTVTGTAAPNNNYSITCNFRVRRNF